MGERRKRQKPIARNKKNYRASDKGAGMTEAGIKAHRRANPGSKLKGAVTGKVKAGSKSAKRRKSYCARSAKSFPRLLKILKADYGKHVKDGSVKT